LPNTASNHLPFMEN